MSKDTDSAPAGGNETTAGPTAGGETESIPNSIRDVPTPAAWSTEPEAVDYPPTGAEQLFAPSPSWRTVWGYAGIVLACAVVIAVLTGIVGWIWTRTGDTTAPNRTAQTSASASPASASPESAPRPSLTDAQGWTSSYARCNPGNPPALIAQTTKSLVVVCEAGAGNYYYRAVRVSDAASIELANTVRTSAGFDVTNPANGTRREVRPTVLNIISPDGQVDSEPMVQYTLVSPPFCTPGHNADTGCLPIVTPTTPTAAPTPVIPEVNDPAPQLLRRQADADRPVVTTWATNRWVPQLSSKHPGSRDDGVVWDDDSIWDEHTTLRQKYDAKLLWSGDWPKTFRGHDYWVTIAGVSYPDRASAQAWCDAHGRDADHCFPTLIQ